MNSEKQGRTLSLGSSGNRAEEGKAVPSTPGGRRSPSGEKIPFGTPAIKKKEAEHLPRFL